LPSFGKVGRAFYAQWHAVGVILHHELRAGRVDPHGLLMLTNATEARRTLLDTPPSSPLTPTTGS